MTRISLKCYESIVYIDNSQLSKELAACKSAGKLSEEFAGSVLIIAKGHLRSDKYIGKSEDWREDFLSRFLIAFVKHWQKIDETKNIHAYLCRMVDNAAKDEIIYKNRYHEHNNYLYHLAMKYYIINETWRYDND